MHSERWNTPSLAPCLASWRIGETAPHHPPRHTHLVALIAACVLASLSADVATAGTRVEQLPCFISLDSAAKWAVADTAFATSAGGGTATDSTGWEFAHDNTEDDEIFCQIVVPLDYDGNASTPPKVRLTGWSMTCVLCIPGLTCDTTRKVEWEVQSRAYDQGFTANAAWGTAAVGTWNFSSESCGSPCSTNCYVEEKVKQVVINAAASAVLWDVNKLVYIRILRDRNATNDLPAFVHLSSVALEYPTP